MSLGRSAPDSADDDAGLQFGSMPTIQVTLGALELEFDKQLGEVVDNLFGDEFASLEDLEPITTTTTPLDVSDSRLAGLLETGLFRKTAPVVPTAGSSSQVQHRPSGDVYTVLNDGDTITRTTSIGRGSTSALFQSNDSSKLTGSGSEDQDTVTRSTMPASSSGSSHRTREPTMRSTLLATDETITRSTNAPTSPTGPPPGTKNRFTDVLEPITRSALFSGAPSTETTPRKSALIAHVPTFVESIDHNPRFSADVLSESSFVSHYNMPSLNPGQPHHPRTVENVNDDIDMSSDFHRNTFAGSHTQNTRFDVPGCPQNASMLPCMPVSNAMFNFSPPSQGSFFASAADFLPVDESEAVWAAHNSSTYASQLEPPLDYPSQPDPSIFELIEPQVSSYPVANQIPYIIPGVAVPDHVWEEERAREERRDLERRWNTATEPPRRARVFASCFSRTSLVSRHERRGKKIREGLSLLRTAKGQVPLLNRRKPMQERPPSPAFSCSSDGSSISARSFVSGSTSSSYYRKLSSPPPFAQRLHHQRNAEERSRQPAGVFIFALQSFSWLCSKKA
ncbi:hypothetical protein C8R43DRAFT_1236801 [Mycena crocata]|nr:hypothetical protein C8R43DRAFT_1236801 [Mycena crocata]